MITPDEKLAALYHLQTANWAYERLTSLVTQNIQVGLILINIDRMKLFMDCHSIPGSEQQFSNIVQKIEAISPRNVSTYRRFGDEIGIILEGSSLEETRNLAEAIRNNQKPIQVTHYKGKEYETLTLSLGVAHYPSHVCSSNGLIEAAELALLKAKCGGRLKDGTPYIGRNRVMIVGDFIDDFPDECAQLLTK